MRLIWTRSSLPLSKLIRYGLNEPVSHFGIVFDNGIVFHSNLLGTHVEWYGTFAKGCEIVYSKDFDLTLDEEEEIFQSILSTYDGKGYDFGAFGYFLWCGILYRTLGKPFPAKNEWNSGDKFLCTELASCLPDSIVSAKVKRQDLSIVSPYRLFLGMNEG